MKNLFLSTLFLLLTAVGAISCVDDPINPAPEPEPVEVASVTLNRTDVLLGIEGTARLVAKVLPADAENPTVEYTSSNEAVATVDASGQVTAIAAGTATITATAGEKTAECTLTVDPDIVVASSLSLDKRKFIIDAGKSEQLTATLLPAEATVRTLEWDSSDEAVASVDDEGTVTGVDAGVAFITVTTADGSLAAVCEVTVEVAVTGVSLNKTELELGLGNGETLIATIAPSDATYKEVVWSSDHPEIASVDAGGTVRALGEGTATITVTTVDEGKTDTCTVTVVYRSFWSRSNVVWIGDSSKPDGGYLTFAIDPEDNALIPANVQGVQFLWGSLVAINPVGTYVADEYPDGSIVYSPTGLYNYDYSWAGSPPYPNNANPVQDGGEGTQFGVASVAVTDDDFAVYNNNTGFNETTGKGDICRLISAKGWVTDNWRLPTAQEYLDLIAENSAGSIKYGDWAKGTVTAGNSEKGANAYGFYQITSARMLGGGAAEGDDITNPSGGVAFPASGYRDAYGVYNAGSEGDYASASSNTTTNSHPLQITASSAVKASLARTRAMSVRCVRDE